MDARLRAKGTIELTLRDAAGTVIEHRVVQNRVVMGGLVHLAFLLLGSSQKPMSHIAIGAGTTAPEKDDKALRQELARRGVSRDRFVDTTWVTAIFMSTFPPGDGTGYLSELGLFDAATGGAMFARATFSPVEKTEDSTLEVRWNIHLIPQL